MRRVAVVWIGLLLCSLALGQTSALIVRFSRVRDASANTGTSIAHFLAGELDQDGRVLPIVWSLTDPVFRAAAESGAVRMTQRDPNPEDVKDAAQKLRATYIITIVEEKSEGALFATLELYKTGSTTPIYKNTRNLAVTVGDRLDWENAARSHAHFWFTALTEGAFKKLKPKPKPAEDVTALPPPPAEVFPADPNALETAKQKIAGGDFAGGLVSLRDAVDADPINYDKRLALIDLLQRMGLISQSATELRSTSALFPDKLELRLRAARAWMAIDRFEEATSDLNYYLARRADDFTALCLHGDLAIARLDPELSLDSYAKSIELKDSFGARFGRALAFALLGNADASALDLEKLGTPSESEILASYPVAVQNLERAVESLGVRIRKNLQQSRVTPRSPEVIADATACVTLAEGLAGVTSKIPVPKKHEQSHLRRDLAQKLLVQAASETLAFAKSADEDTGSDAAISLGDALKQLGAIRKQYDAERNS